MTAPTPEEMWESRHHPPEQEHERHVYVIGVLDERARADARKVVLPEAEYPQCVECMKKVHAALDAAGIEWEDGKP